MPLLVEVPGRLGYVMLVHDVQDVVTHTLAIARTLAYHGEHLPKEVCRRQERLLVFTVEAGIERTYLIGQSHLGPLQVLRLSIVVLLPSELASKRVSEPYEKVGAINI